MTARFPTAIAVVLMFAIPVLAQTGTAERLGQKVQVKGEDVGGVPVAEVKHPEDALVDPRVVARHETMAVGHPRYGSKVDLRTAGVPIQFSAAETGFDEALPVRIGEHNEAIYKGLLGYSDERLAQLRAAAAI